MTKEEKINYLWERNKGIIFGALVLAAVSVLVLLLSKEASWHNIALFILLFLFVSLLVLIIVRLFYPINIFSQKVQITDGYIDERSEYSFSDSRRVYFATAKTNDGSKTTLKKRIPFWFRHGKIPVKIIVCNNIACDYLITKDSYEYADKHRGEIEKKTDRNQGIIGIILIIIIIVGLIMLLK